MGLRRCKLNDALAPREVSRSAARPGRSAGGPARTALSRCPTYRGAVSMDAPAQPLVGGFSELRHLHAQLEQGTVRLPQNLRNSRVVIP
jgi:hypothetical protein